MEVASRILCSWVMFIELNMSYSVEIMKNLSLCFQACKDISFTERILGRNAKGHLWMALNFVLTKMKSGKYNFQEYDLNIRSIGTLINSILSMFILFIWLKGIVKQILKYPPYS